MNRIKKILLKRNSQISLPPSHATLATHSVENISSNFERIPNELLQLIFEFYAYSAVDVTQKLFLVCKRWHWLCVDDENFQNRLWCLLMKNRWPHLNTEMNILNWRNFYKKRLTAITRLNISSNSIPIENCELEFKCPIFDHGIEIEPDTFSCDTCQRNVYQVYTEGQKLFHRRAGNRIMFNPWKPTSLNHPGQISIPVLDLFSPFQDKNLEFHQSLNHENNSNISLIIPHESLWIFDSISLLLKRYYKYETLFNENDFRGLLLVFDRWNENSVQSLNQTLEKIIDQMEAQWIPILITAIENPENESLTPVISRKEVKTLSKRYGVTHEIISLNEFLERNQGKNLEDKRNQRKDDVYSLFEALPQVSKHDADDYISLDDWIYQLRIKYHKPVDVSNFTLGLI